MSLYFQLTALYLGVMQNMHPGLGAGVEFHSTINDEFWQRVLRSLYPIAGVVFDGEQAASTAKDVVGYHKTINGTDSQGRRYNALDPGTFYWAHATFFMATVLSGDLLMGGLTDQQKEQLWQEHYQWYRLYGMSMRVVPESWEDFQIYWEHMCNDVLEKNKATTDLFTIMRSAPVPPIPVFRLIPDRLWRITFPRLAPFGIWATMGLCPPAVRAKLGYRWSDRDERRFQFGARMFRVAWAATPAPVEYWFPRIRAARLREAGRRTTSRLPQAPEYLLPPAERRGSPQHYCPATGTRQ